MKKKLSYLLSVLLLATLLTTIAIYKRPMTLEQMCPGISLENCQSIKTYHYVEGNGAESDWVPVLYSAGSEPFEAIMDQLEGRKFRKSLRNWLPSNGIHCYPNTHEDIRWDLILTFGDTLMPDGSTERGDLITLHYFCGVLQYSDMNGTFARCSTPEQQQWSAAIQSILTSTF